MNFIRNVFIAIFLLAVSIPVTHAIISDAEVFAAENKPALTPNNIPTKQETSASPLTQDDYENLWGQVRLSDFLRRWVAIRKRAETL